MAKSATTEVPETDDFRGTLHVYKPYRAGLPQMGPYLREVWRRREFMAEFARASIRGSQQSTWFGQLWNVLNPLFLAFVYFLLVNILSDSGAQPRNFFVYLIAALFLFSSLQSAMMDGARSIVSAGKMITNTAFPRVMLPLGEVRIMVRELVPMLGILVLAMLIWRVDTGPSVICAIPLLVLFFLMASGLAMMMATAQVYFRDTRNFLGYLGRLWLYASPVLYLPGKLSAENQRIMEIINPMFSMVGAWGNALVYGRWPSEMQWLTATVWSVVIFFLGGYFFLSRERDFAVRI